MTDLEVDLDRMPYALIARAAHEANRAYAEMIGDDNKTDRWERTPAIIQASVIAGVREYFIAATQGTMLTPPQMHQRWFDYKTAEGWKFGPTKNVELKLHPNLVPFDELSVTQQAKDYIFCGVVGIFVELLLLPANLAILHRAAREGMLQSLRPDIEEISAAEFLALRQSLPLADPRLRPDNVIAEQEKNADAEVDDSGRDAAAGDDAAAHTLPVSPVREAPEGAAAERDGGSDGSGSESGQG